MVGIDREEVLHAAFLHVRCWFHADPITSGWIALLQPFPHPVVKPENFVFLGGQNSLLMLGTMESRLVQFANMLILGDHLPGKPSQPIDIHLTCSQRGSWQQPVDSQLCSLWFQRKYVHGPNVVDVGDDENSGYKVGECHADLASFCG